MGRSNYSYKLSHNLTEQFKCFEGSKEEFMQSIDGVTTDIRVETVVRFQEEMTYYYCTVFQGAHIFEVFSFGDEKTWHAKN